MQKRIANPVQEDIGRKLGEARARKRLSQRALGERVGLPQAHISKIEQGRVDLRLSSLVELARALDFDVRLVPRQALPALEGVVRSVESEAQDSSGSRGLATLARQAQLMDAFRRAYPNLEAARKLATTVRELKPAVLDSEGVRALQRAVAPVEAAARRIGPGLDAHSLARTLEEADRRLRTLRTLPVHGLASPGEPAAAVPAYSLDEDEDD